MRLVRRIEKETPLIPEIVASTVLGNKASKGKIISLVNRAEELYRINKSWRRYLHRENANEWLYVFMAHWADAKIWYKEWGTVDYDLL